MAKFKLEQAIESSYSFAFRRFLSVLGIAWFPLAVFVGLLCLIAAVLWPEVQGLQDAVGHGWGANGNFSMSDANWQRVWHLFLHAGHFFGLIWLAALILRTMVIAGVLETALGMRQGPQFFYFSLGAPVWRLIGAFIVAGVATIVVALLTVAAAAATIWAAQQYAAGILGLVKFLAIAAAVLWIIYFCVRLFYFLPPVVVAEGAIALGRAWSLGSGNFWRVVALWLATFLPVVIVATILSGALFGIQENDMLMAMLKANSPAAAMHVAFSQYGLLLIGLAVYEIAYFTLMLGLGLGAMASAYKGAAAPEAA